MESCQPIKRLKDKKKNVSTMSIGKDGFHYLVPGPAPTVVGLRPFAAAFVTLAASSDGVAVSHTAAVVPNADAVARAGGDEAAVGLVLSDSFDPVAALATACSCWCCQSGYNSTAS